jgi:nitrate/nitrite-specific signal transduction histidine kinase
MRERAERVGGRCEAATHPQGGTVVFLEFPSLVPPT